MLLIDVIMYVKLMSEGRPKKFHHLLSNSNERINKLRTQINLFLNTFFIRNILQLILTKGPPLAYMNKYMINELLGSKS